MKILYIGWDFDGVCANNAKLRAEVARDNFKVRVPEEDTTEEGFLSRGFTDEEYLKMKKIVYSTYDILPYQGFLTCIKQLTSEGHHHRIISHRTKEPGLKIINNFVSSYKLETDIICTDSTPKSNFCAGLDVFIDDRQRHLIDLKGKVENLFLFRRGYNIKESLEKGIDDVFEFGELYKKIIRIAK